MISDFWAAVRAGNLHIPPEVNHNLSEPSLIWSSKTMSGNASRMDCPLTNSHFYREQGLTTFPSVGNWCQMPSAPCVASSPWPTIQHILNECPVVSPKRGSYTWHHNSALMKLVIGQPEERLYADLPGMRALLDNPLSTIPVEILDTPAHSDIVIARKLKRLPWLNCPIQLSWLFTQGKN